MTGAILVWILINSKRSLFIKRKKIRSFGFFRFSRIFFDGKNWWKILKYKNRNATFWVIFKHCDKDEINTFLPKDATFHLVIRWSLKTTKSFPMFFESIHCDWKSTKKSHSKLKIWTFCQIMLTFLSSAYFLPNYAWICLFIISWFLPNYSHICFSISLIFPNYAHISFI